MKLSRKFGVLIVGLTLVFASAYAANAGMDGGAYGQTAQTSGAVFHDNQNFSIVPVVSWSAPSVTSDRGEGENHTAQYHAYGGNQFGDQMPQADNSPRGATSREADYQAHHWTPETYGLMGDYGRDSR